MAIFEQPIMPEKERNGIPSFTAEEDSSAPNFLHERTPMPESSSARPPRSSKLLKKTPSDHHATPATAAMSPDTSLVDPSLLYSDVPKQLICTIQRALVPQDNSSSSTASTAPAWPPDDDSEKSGSPQYSLGGGPSFTQHGGVGGGRTLFHLDEDGEENSSFEEDVHDVFLQQSKQLPPAPSSSAADTGPRYRSDGPPPRSNFRSRRSSLSLTLENGGSSRRHSRGTPRSRSAGEGSDFLMAAVAVSQKDQPVSSDEEEDAYGDYILRSDSSQSPYRQDSSSLWNSSRRKSSYSSRRRSFEGSEPMPWIFSKLLPRRISCMVWILCVVGLTSMATVIVMHTSNKDLERMEQRDHIAVLFRTNNAAHGSVARPSTPLRGVKQPAQEAPAPLKKERRQSEHRHRAVDLHHLAQHVDETKPRSLPEEEPQLEDHHSDPQDKAKKHHSKKEKHTHHHESKSAQLTEESTNDPIDSNRSGEDHHHHHRHHSSQEIQREFARVHRRGVIGLSAIPFVALPPTALDLGGESEDHRSASEFDSVDRNLYITRETTSDNARVVVLDGSPGAEDWQPEQHRAIELYPAEFTDNTQLYSVLDSGDEPVSSKMERREPFVQGECVPMQEWQTTFHPSCNGMHEVDMSEMGDNKFEDDIKLFGMKGFWRNAWRYDSIGGHSAVDERDTVVLKTLRINHRFEDAYYEHNRIDAVVLERLTASPHVINVFGFCGHSVITEYADGKRLGELADKMKNVPRARLSIARDIASGLADVHGIDGDGNATFVHLDINPANVVSIGGTLKLNDFNIGVLRRWNTTSHTPCGIPAQYPNPQWRSPEEARRQQDLTEKVDVFSLGHIFFRLICGHEPWHKLEPGGLPRKDVLNEKVKQGNLPHIPNKIMVSTDPEVVAIREAMLRCYTYDPTKRPSAREIALSLTEALNEFDADLVEED